MNTPITPSAANPLKLGTRRSPLAMAQAEETRARLCAAPYNYVNIILRTGPTLSRPTNNLW